MSQRIIPIGNFDLNFKISWDSNNSNNPMNKLLIAIYDEYDDLISMVGYIDSWVSYSGTKSIITKEKSINFNGINSLSHKGILDFQISRNRDEISVSCNNIFLTTIFNDSCVYKISLIFGHYPYKDGSKISTIGKVSVDYIKIDGELASSNALILKRPQSNIDNNYIRFNWNQLPNVSSYMLQISEDLNFSKTIITKETIHTSHNSKNLEVGHFYYARVKANDNSIIRWSNIQQFIAGQNEIENETTKYTQGNPFFVSDPINSATGSYSYSGLDISFSSIIPFQFYTTYQTFSSNFEPLGIKWNHSYNIKLTFNDYASIFWPDGSRHDYEALPDNENIYIRRGVDNGDNLFKDNNENYILVKKNFMKYIFNNLGCLIYIKDKNDNTICFEYNNQNQLNKVFSNEVNGYLNFIYDDKNRLYKISDHTNRMVQYKYDERNDLITYIDTLGNEKKFTYDDKHLMKTATDQNGNTFISNEYDEINRVISQTDARGNTVYLSYDTITEQGKTITTYSDSDGITKIYKHISENSNLVEYIDPLGNKTIKKYDGFNNLITNIDPMGQSVGYTTEMWVMI